MKVLMPVLHYYPVIGGLETWTQNIAESLSQRVKIYVVTGKVRNQLKRETLNNVKIFRTSLFSLKNLSYSSPFYILTVLPFIFLKSLIVIKREKIDFLHCQGFLSSFLGYFLSIFTGIPYIVTVQRMEENKGFLRKVAFKNAKICIAASLAIKKYFEELGCKNIEIIPNGIDLERFKNLDRIKNRERLGVKEEFLVMAIARLEKVKGIDYLIGAADILNKKYKKQNIKYFIIGDGSQGKNLNNLVKKLNLKEKIKFLGQIPNEKIPEYLSAADCFVLPSLKEGFGIVILEAMAAVLPVVATKVGGILDIIEDGKNGILIEPGDSKEIVKAIQKIYSKKELSLNLVQNAKMNLEKYDWKTIAQRVYLIYQNLI